MFKQIKIGLLVPLIGKNWVSAPIGEDEETVVLCGRLFIVDSKDVDDAIV